MIGCPSSTAAKMAQLMAKRDALATAHLQQDRSSKINAYAESKQQGTPDARSAASASTAEKVVEAGDPETSIRYVASLLDAPMLLELRDIFPRIFDLLDTSHLRAWGAVKCQEPNWRFCDNPTAADPLRADAAATGSCGAATR